MPANALDWLFQQRGPTPGWQVEQQPPPTFSPWEQFTRALPQPLDVFGGGNPGYPVAPLGWGDIVPRLWDQFQQQPWPERPPGYWDDPANWPPGRIPGGPYGMAPGGAWSQWGL